MLEGSPAPKEALGAGDSEAEFADAIARADWRGALTLLMERYGDAIYRFCRQMIGDETLAADVHQLTFVQAFSDLASFSGRSLVRTWLFGIARHRCVDALRARRRWQGRFEPLKSEGDRSESIDPAPPADERMSRQEIVAALDRCLGELASGVKIVVLLRHVEGFSYEDMSRICGERAGTLQARVARAMPVLRACIERRTGRSA